LSISEDKRPDELLASLGENPTIRIGNRACFQPVKKRGRQGYPCHPRGRKYWRCWV